MQFPIFERVLLVKPCISSKRVITSSQVKSKVLICIPILLRKYSPKLYLSK